MMKIELELHKVADRLPDKDGEYLCFWGGDIETLPYSTKYKAFNTHSFSEPDHAARVALLEVEYWAELPAIEIEYKR